MANLTQSTSAPSGEPNVSMTLSQFQEMMRTIVAEIRKPPVDPIKEAQKVREKEMKEQGLREMWARKERKKKVCLHSRPDGSCVIAWSKASDEKWYGYCPHCDSTFSQEQDGKEEFAKLFNRPRGMMENVRVIA